MNSLFPMLSLFFDPLFWGAALVTAGVVVVLERFGMAKSQEQPKIASELVSAAIAASSHHLTYRGGISDYFLNLDYIATTPDDVIELSQWYIKKINRFSAKKSVDLLAFIEKGSGPVGAISLMSTIVKETKLPSVIIRLRKRVSLARVVGKDTILHMLSQRANVLMVTDVVTTGRTINSAKNAITKLGGNVIGVCTLLDRTSGLDEQNDLPILHGVTEAELREKGYIKRY